MINAYEQGIDDGFFKGEQNPPESNDERVAYQRGYDHGVWMYCQTLQEETE